MSLVFTVILKATTLSSQCADEVGVFDTCLLEFLPEKCTPAPLALGQLRRSAGLGKIAYWAASDGVAEWHDSHCGLALS
jgi:hypothetical protein